jgi:hypothetical protein
MSEKQSKPRAKKSTKTTRKKSKGLGDTVEKVTEATGIKAAVEWFSETTGIDCGCDTRKEKLNKLFPYKSKINCLEQSEHETLKQFYKEFNGREVHEKWMEPLAVIHARVFEHKFYVPCSCNPREWNQVLQDLKKVYRQYEGA